MVRPQLEVAESLPGVLRELTHFAVCVGGQGSGPGGHGRLLVPGVNASFVLLALLRTAVRWWCKERMPGC